MPKIEISMLLEELSSEEADKFIGRQRDVSFAENHTTTERSHYVTTTTTVKEESDEISETRMESVKTNDSEVPTSKFEKISSKPEPGTLETPETSTTIIFDDYSDDFATTTFSAKPMLLSEFANHLANGLKVLEPELTTPSPTTTPTVFVQFPDEGFPFMVSAAKEFIRRYLSMEQWKKLRTLLKTIKDVGGSRIDIHRAATMFISKVISKSEMDEITNRQQELFHTFNRRYFYRKRNMNLR